MTDSLEYSYFDYAGRFILKSGRVYDERHDWYAGIFRGKRSVVDLGCGMGQFLDAFERLGITATGIETNKEIVDYLEGRNRRCIRSDIFDYLESCADGSHDGIMASHVIEHLPPGRAGLLIRQSFRVLSSDGLLVLLFPNPESLSAQMTDFWKDPTHVRFYHGEFVAFLMDNAGFDTRRHAAFNHFENAGTSLKKRLLAPLRNLLIRLAGISELKAYQDNSREVCLVGKKRPGCSE